MNNRRHAVSHDEGVVNHARRVACLMQHFCLDLWEISMFLNQGYCNCPPARLYACTPVRLYQPLRSAFEFAVKFL